MSRMDGAGARRGRSRLVGGVLVVAVVAMGAGCGDDGSDDEAGPGDEDAAPSDPFCAEMDTVDAAIEALVVELEGPGDMQVFLDEAVDAFATVTPPDELSDDWEVVSGGLTEAAGLAADRDWDDIEDRLDELQGDDGAGMDDPETQLAFEELYDEVMVPFSALEEDEIIEAQSRIDNYFEQNCEI